MNKGLAVFTAVIFITGITGCSSNEFTSETGSYKIPSPVIEKTSAYIMERTGPEFFAKNFRFDNDKSAIDSPYYHISYRFTIPDQPLIDEVVTITTDFSGKIAGNKIVSGIPECTKDTMLCSFIINEAGAKEIARKNGLSEGITDWRIDFTWDEKFEKYVWQVRSIKSEGNIEGKGYRGNGEQVIIDPSTGDVLDKSEWFVR